MKNTIKITAISTLLIISCLLIGACGGGAEQLVQGQGEVDISTTDSTTKAALPSVTIQVSTSSGGAPYETDTTDANGSYKWVSPTGGVGSNYFFTFSKVGYVTQANIEETPQATSTITLPVAMVPSS
jgi:hypothetical protein